MNLHQSVRKDVSIRDNLKASKLTHLANASACITRGPTLPASRGRRKVVASHLLEPPIQMPKRRSARQPVGPDGPSRAPKAKSNLRARPPVNIHPASLGNSDAENTQSRPNEQMLRRTPAQGIRQRNRRATNDDRTGSSASLGPAHLAKVSSHSRGGKAGHKRNRKTSQQALSDVLPSSTGMNTAESQPLPGRVAPRRSERIRNRQAS